VFPGVREIFGNAADRAASGAQPIRDCGNPLPARLHEGGAP
jgi:hypothetical protein